MFVGFSLTMVILRHLTIVGIKFCRRLKFKQLIDEKTRECPNVNEGLPDMTQYWKSLGVVGRVSDRCLTPNEQMFTYVMERANYIQCNHDDVHFSLDQHG